MQEMEELNKYIADKKVEELGLMEDLRNSQKNLDVLSAKYKDCRDLSQNLDAKLNPIKVKNLIQYHKYI